MKYLPERVHLTAVIQQGGDAGDAEGDVCESFPPWSAEGVRDDDGEPAAVGFFERRLDLPRRSVRVLGQQDDIAGRHVGVVYPGIGADETVSRLADHHAALLA